MPLILGTNSIKDTGFQVANSCRFNGADSHSMARTISAGSSGKIYTISFWMKKSAEDTINNIFHLSSDGNTAAYIEVATKSNYGIDFQFKDGSGGTFLRRRITRDFRDFSAWMNIVLRFDSTNSTASDRARIYVNGIQATDVDQDSTPDVPLNFVSDLNTSGATLVIGKNISTGFSSHYDGYLAEMVLIDGSSLGPDSFGEFDSDSPTIWKPIDVSGLTFGTNGFYLDFEDSSSLGNDSAGSNNFTVTNLTSLNQSIDTCTNNFATWDPNNRNTSMGSFHHGNLEYEVDASFFRTAFATFGADQGKWYFECKRITGSSFSIGIISLDYKNRTSNVSYIGGAGDATNNIGYLKDGNISIGGSETSGYASYGNGETVMVAMDLDNGKVYFGVDGTWGNSGNPESGATGTGAVSFTPSGETWTFAVSVFDSHWEANFGSPMYSITSGNSDGEGIGNFEFTVPSGYFSMCSRNLAEYG
jgi:hypothetical protein